jgi:hypothetical protein
MTLVKLRRLTSAASCRAAEVPPQFHSSKVHLFISVVFYSNLNLIFDRINSEKLITKGVCALLMPQEITALKKAIGEKCDESLKSYDSYHGHGIKSPPSEIPSMPPVIRLQA